MPKYEKFREFGEIMPSGTPVLCHFIIQVNQLEYFDQYGTSSKTIDLLQWRHASHFLSHPTK